MKPRSELILLMLLLLASYALRLSLISKGPYHVDCLNVTVKAQEFLATGQLPFLFGPGYPLTILLGALFIWAGRLLGSTDAVGMVNHMSVFFSALCGPLLYLIGRRINFWTGLIGSVIVSLTPIVLGVSLYGKSHAPALFFLLCGILFWSKFRESGQLGFFVTAALAVGGLGASRGQDMVLMMPALIFLQIVPWPQSAIHRPDRQHISYQRVLMFWVIAFGVTILFHLPYLSEASYRTNLLSFWVGGAGNNFEGLWSEHLIRSVGYLQRSFSMLGLLCAVVGCVLLTFRQPRWMTFLMLWFAVPLLIYGNMISAVPRFLVLICPPVALGIGYALSILMKRHWAVRLLAVYVLLMITMIPLLDVLPAYLYRHRKAKIVDYCHWLQEVTEEDARIIIPDLSPFLKHYTQRQAFPRPLSPRRPFDSWALESFKTDVDIALAQQVPLYITETGLRTYDYGGVFVSFMAQNYRLVLIGTADFEDWRAGELTQVVISNNLYRIEPK